MDYVKCLDVDYASERNDKVQDFSLAIRPFGSTKPVKSLTEAIELFLRPEILDKENQYVFVPPSFQISSIITNSLL